MDAILRYFGVHIITSRQTIERTLQLTTFVDRLSYDHVRVGDHILIPDTGAVYPNAHTILSAMAVLTKRVRLSTAVTDSYRRHPAEIAQAVATLDVLTSGRAMLGIGAGEVMNLEPFGIEWVSPVRRLREAVEVIRLLWSATPDKPATYRGRIFQLRDAFLQVSPLQKPTPPIYIGAAGPKTRELAGMIGDGWLPVAVETPKTLKRHLEDVEKGAERSGRRADELDIDVTVYTAISDDFEESYQCVAPSVKGVLVQQREVLKELTGIEIPESLSLQRMDPTDRSSLEAMNELAGKIPRSVVEEVAAFGSPDSCIKKLEEFLKSGATSITICNLSPEPEKTFRIYSEKIIPYMREIYSG